MPEVLKQYILSIFSLINDFPRVCFNPFSFEFCILGTVYIHPCAKYKYVSIE